MSHVTADLTPLLWEKDNPPNNPFRPWCIGCGRFAPDIPEVLIAVAGDVDRPFISRVDVNVWVMKNEGTYNKENGHFACDSCYIAMGQPSLPYPFGWKAP